MLAKTHLIHLPPWLKPTDGGDCVLKESVKWFKSVTWFHMMIHYFVKQEVRESACQLCPKQTQYQYSKPATRCSCFHLYRISHYLRHNITYYKLFNFSILYLLYIYPFEHEQINIYLQDITFPLKLLVPICSKLKCSNIQTLTVGWVSAAFPHWPDWTMSHTALRLCACSRQSQTCWRSPHYCWLCWSEGSVCNDSGSVLREV